MPEICPKLAARRSPHQLFADAVQYEMGMVRRMLREAGRHMAVSGQRILVVEDERAIANVLRRGLALEGYTVEVADAGRAALDSVRDRPPELVVLDLMLP